ncbi:hypothetical protein GCM10007301_25510 [Azorhizobium oxalatiphilum]|uniref:Uncharacterized protein n=1 Tax=Azorhizobium oxalatiphilum TaxID=980631 RepID=A0A917BZF3_9HYPH|nr:hypothetical protein [Azorhizobium oxalatiphilum]GGF64621.1 hypothetical protein GCM10007301_25510 [Azorhizobium oxalatiphilum]
MSEPATTPAPAPVCRIRLSVGASLGAYPVITGILYGLAEVAGDMAVWQKTLAIVPLMVPCMVFAIIPGVHKVGGRWIRRSLRS